MIASGEKKEEYRELKNFFVSRLFKKSSKVTIDYVTATIGLGKLEDYHYKPIRYDAVEFINGYSKDSPRIMTEFKGVEVGKGRKEWGAPDYDVIKIKLGEIINN